MTKPTAKLRKPEQLNLNECRTLIRAIRRVLYWDAKNGRWDPDKEWSIDTVEEVALAIDEYGLIPARPPEEKTEGK